MQVWVWGRAAAAIEAKLQARLFRRVGESHAPPSHSIPTATSRSATTAPDVTARTDTRRTPNPIPLRSTMGLDMVTLDQCRTSDVLQRLTSDVQEVTRALEVC